jgi:hypothetical protein
MSLSPSLGLPNHNVDTIQNLNRTIEVVRKEEGFGEGCSLPKTPSIPQDFCGPI